MFDRRAFSEAGPTVWNSLQESLQDKTRSFDSFRCDLSQSASKGLHSELEALRLCAIEIYDWLPVHSDICRRLHIVWSSVLEMD